MKISVIDNITFIENDIFFDADVVQLLKLVRDCKRPGSFEVINFQNIFCLLNKNNKTVTNFYQSIATVELYKKIHGLINYIKQLDFKYEFEFLRIGDIEENLIHSDLSEKCAVVNLENYDLKKMKKGHRQNIQKAYEKNVKIEIFYNCAVEENVIREFYNSVLVSRNAFGKKFEHAYETFLFRKFLIEKGKAILVIAEYESKKSFVFSLVGKNNSFYYDSGYTSKANPFIAHYAQHNLMLYLKMLGGKYYNLGKINNLNAVNNSSIKNDKIDYYKSGFCKSLTDVITVRL